MTPMQTIYQQQLAHGQIHHDPAQHRLVELLDDFSEKMHSHFEASWIERLSKRSPHPGHLYIWGQVGRGKTMLMDLFFNHARVKKQRLHFGSFMRWLHQQLNQHSGTRNPLEHIARQTAQGVQLLCFDEFQVLDIGDAMLLATLLEQMLEQPTVFCITSNLPPSDLYKDGLQRSRFVPAIKLLEDRFQIISLDAEQDFRRLHLAQTQNYLHPVTEENSRAFFASFARFAPTVSDQSIRINGRAMPTLGVGPDLVCIDFATLCRDPRSTADYLAISERFRIVFLAHLEQLRDPDDSDAVRRFINLVDQLYDNRVLLVCLAHTAIDQIYSGSLFAQPFERCHSRLIEMQSEEYQQLCLKRLPESVVNPV